MSAQLYPTIPRGLLQTDDVPARKLGSKRRKQYATAARRVPASRAGKGHGALSKSTMWARRFGMPLREMARQHAAGLPGGSPLVALRCAGIKIAIETYMPTPRQALRQGSLC